uniref:Pseudouridine-5'-phosphate glycosidase n=1 Tax=Trichogramma kaykai TaxID=54128 RepID=A0ABD2XI00_9HYME
MGTTSKVPSPCQISQRRRIFKLADVVNGVIPATIAVLNGIIKVGLSKTEFKKLSEQSYNKLLKISRRDLSFVISQGLSGGTTISSTIAIAKAMNLPVIATGGMGGVHRDSDISMDISADLKQLGEASIAVVCSGIKSLLDVSKTLEYLETISVPVITIGSSSKFPAFLCQETYEGLESHLHLKNVRSASELIVIEKYLQSEIGTLIAVPVPKKFSMKPEEVEKIIEKIKTETTGIKGQNVTPFFLKQLSELSSNQTKHSNIALLKNNAEVAAELAICLNLNRRKKYISNKYADTVSFNNKLPVC